MAYTTIDKPTDYFNTVLYSGNGGTQSITGVGHASNLIWIKARNDTANHTLTDVVRGTNSVLYANQSYAQDTPTNAITSFDSDGFSLGSNGSFNQSSTSYCSWNWSAGGTAPAITYSVKVVSDSGNKYRFDDFGTSAVTLDLQEGGTYTFDQSDSSNSGHPLRFSTTSDGSHGGGSEYTTGVTTTGTPGSAGAKTVITVGSGVATLYYYCTQHSGMGGQANTNSTHGSSNFSGSIQSTVSANITAGFSLVSYTGNQTAGATIGHGLGVAPSIMIVKSRNSANPWTVYHKSISETKAIYLNLTNGTYTATNIWNDTAPTSSVFSVGSNDDSTNKSSEPHIAYCFADTGNKFFKAGSYTGNGSSDGSYIHLGFKAAFIMIKGTGSGTNWFIQDNKRNPHNIVDKYLNADSNAADQSADMFDITANGIKQRNTFANLNGSGSTYIYMAFAENPFVTSTGIPTTAR